LDEVQAIEKWETEFELANMYSIQYSPIKKYIDFDRPLTMIMNL
jgi:hypothetical protein